MNHTVISPITHINTLSQSNTTFKKHSNVNFKGPIGNKFVSMMESGNNVGTKNVLDKIKGFWGINKNKAEDVIQSFITKIKELKNDNTSLTAQLKEKQAKNLKLKEDNEKLLSKYELELKDKNETLQKLNEKIEYWKESIEREREEANSNWSTTRGLKSTASSFEDANSLIEQSYR